MTEKTNDYLLSSELYTTEAEESKARVEAEKKINDPKEEEMKKFFAELEKRA